MSIRGIDICGIGITHCTIEMLSYFPSMNYYHVSSFERLPTIVQDVISNCKELRCALFRVDLLSLDVTHNHNLQQLYIGSPQTDVTNDFMTSVSTHGGLVHVVLHVRSFQVEGITSMVRNSPNMITLCCYSSIRLRATVRRCKAKLKKIFRNRALFTAGHCEVVEYPGYDNLQNVLHERGTDLFSLWIHDY